MPIVKQEVWNSLVAKNSRDRYSKAIIDASRKVMEWIDEMPENEKLDSDKLITRASRDEKSGSLTGYQTGSIARIIWSVHSRGEEFRKDWNRNCGADPNSEGIANPALFTIGG